MLNSWLKVYIDPSTALGSVVLTVIGTLVAGLAAWLAVTRWQAFWRGRSIYGVYSTLPFEKARDAGFRDGSTKRGETVAVGETDVVFGFALKHTTRAIQFDVRPMRRRLWFWWRDIGKPWPLRICNMDVDQPEWRRMGTWRSQCWYDGEGPDGPGQVCYLSPDTPVLPADHAIWVGLKVKAVEKWSGALSIRVKFEKGPPIRLRLPMSVTALRLSTADTEALPRPRSEEEGRGT